MTARLLIVTCALLCGTALSQALSFESALPPRIPLGEMPTAVGTWRSAAEHKLDASTVAVLRADDYISRTYVHRGEMADLFVGYYASQRQGQTIHSPMNCLPGAGWQPMSAQRLRIDVGSAKPIDANRYVIQKGLDKQLVLYWYQSHRRTVSSEYTAKIYLVLDSLRWGRSDAALIRVISPIKRDEGAAERAAVDFVRALHPVLGRHLPG
jgi:EpsI family protein